MAEGPDSRQGRRSWDRRTIWAALASALVVLLALATLGLWIDVSSLEDEVARLDGRVGGNAEAVTALEARARELEGGSFDPAALAEEVRPSVFAIEAPAGSQTFEGTAFAMARRGRRTLLVTNFHVIKGRWERGARDVLLSRGYRKYQGTIVEAQPSEDLALVQADAELPLLRAASSLPQVGDPVVVIGSAEGLRGTLTTGVVSAVGRRIEGRTWLQFSAPVNPGNSGGPVVDRRGEVVGVATFKAVGVELEGLSFAIPVSRLCDALDVCEH